jgi:hypothetical protein
MAGILRNVVINPPPTERGLFRTMSRNDGKTALPARPSEPPRPRRSAPRRCPVCGSTDSEHAQLFTSVNDLFKCNICNSQISGNGSVVTNGVF